MWLRKNTYCIFCISVFLFFLFFVYLFLLCFKFIYFAFGTFWLFAQFFFITHIKHGVKLHTYAYKCITYAAQIHRHIQSQIRLDVCVCCVRVVYMLCVFLCTVHVFISCVCSHFVLMLLAWRKSGEGGEEVVGSSSCGYFQFGQPKGRRHKRPHYDQFNDRFTSSLSAQLDFYAHIFQLVPLQIIQLLCYELVHKIKSKYLL